MIEIEYIQTCYSKRVFLLSEMGDYNNEQVSTVIRPGTMRTRRKVPLTSTNPDSIAQQPKVEMRSKIEIGLNNSKQLRGADYSARRIYEMDSLVNERNTDKNIQIVESLNDNLREPKISMKSTDRPKSPKPFRVYKPYSSRNLGPKTTDSDGIQSICLPLSNRDKSHPSFQELHQWTDKIVKLHQNNQKLNSKINNAEIEHLMQEWPPEVNEKILEVKVQIIFKLGPIKIIRAGVATQRFGGIVLQYARHSDKI